jgi:hypothetical protein
VLLGVRGWGLRGWGGGRFDVDVGVDGWADFETYEVTMRKARTNGRAMD